MLELAGLIIFGVFAQWIANRLKIPAILPLILIGLAVGPFSTLLTADGHKLVEPMWTGENGLFPGNNMFYFVSLAVSIILFEGGLTLRRSEVLNVGSVILKLVTVAVLISFIGSGIAAHYIFDLPWGISFLFASLVIVTGPTVIRPILRHIPLKKDVSAVLRWEGIIIDPIGAVAAVLVFNIISSSAGQYGEGPHITLETLEGLGKIILFGFTIGFTFAHALAFCIKRNLVAKFLINIFTLATVLAVFVIADELADESGLIAVVIMGMVIGNMDLPNLKEMSHFKESLSILLVSILFILLAANINIDELQLVYNKKALLLFVVVVFGIRPLGVFLSSINSPLKLNEKLFISWVGPRGIVAAGVSSLFGILLTDQGVPGAEYITPLVFMIVLGTVLLNATTARWVAKRLGVFLNKSEGILIIGASPISRLISSYLMRNGRHVVLIDTNHSNINYAKKIGLPAYETSIYSENLEDNLDVSDVGYVMALSQNSEINIAAVDKFQKLYGENGTFRLITQDEILDAEVNPKEGLFSPTDDYVKLSELVRRYPQIHEVPIKSQEHYTGLIEISKTNADIVPLFIKDPTGNLSIIPSNSLEVIIEGENHALVYLGKNMENVDQHNFSDEINEDE